MVHIINRLVVFISSLYIWSMNDYRSWTVKFVPGNFNLLFGVRVLFLHSFLKSTELNSRGHYGRHRCYVMKFCLSSGQHWVFGVVNNYSAVAHVTEVLDNSKFNRTNDVIMLLTLWVCSWSTNKSCHWLTSNLSLGYQDLCLNNLFSLTLFLKLSSRDFSFQVNQKITGGLLWWA